MTREEVAPVAYRVRTFAQLIEASDSGVRELIASGAIRSFKVGGLLRIPASELVKFTGEEEGKEVRPCGCDAGRESK
ncbi:helix-turn-helix domain-containing protein [uncultured Actinomyces sp.]|uniref:helix-turn-helix domain-containing protein n=1 Tax=uncultured Actinomyces sp. TaxID=249061 RepID=UPI0028E1D52C|nr:helix-turn-helix domain-containing protein [uncultured Actinomyces sp.]